ncbi:MAG: mechanosensitive ion channel [Candidatus Aureabacteria bacterium]|nr:mechanosensitive ion channel [Candidatus Auribacterota bacterium]
MNEIYTTSQDYFMRYGMNVIGAILIIFLGRWVSLLLTNLIGKIMGKSKVDQILISFIKNLVYYGLMTVLVIAALNKLGIQTASFIAVVGAAGLAIGMALQGSLSNFASGVLIVIFRPFNIGDKIEVAGVTGIVQEIQIFNTILKSAENKRIILPNSKITADKIIVG